MAKKIYVSPSDQFGNVYAAGNTNEAVQCRQIAQYLVTALKRCGFETKINLDASMYERVAESNSWGADLHVPIHTNAFNEKVTGTRLMCHTLNTEGHRACQAVFKYLAPLTPGTSENITAHPELYECRAAKAPTLFVEADFHDVAEIAKWIVDHKKEIAEAICHGICDHYKVKYVKEEKVALERYKTIDDIPAWAKKEAQELIDAGALQGRNNESGLDITDDMLRCMIINMRYTKSLVK